ncbi:BLUF domain-containing protein [Kordiimonas sp. SCSIO 12610]|uniref:BLUF domain-containing protein n=1 Tax=Kordiimonas sp. SCSIO 12610 TaxID=2829597 RepID=UPI002109C019|nr:BLUF domain-containing protein [Kordiimonas sp. SCSIO 12610]UTW56029.1 BLUF domain-containing protein [Kordiimonas sp. SCSIO 12610]
MLYRLVYLSSYIGVASEEGLKEIFDVASRNNARDNITGLLIFYEGNFFQVIEGEADKVNACFKRIESDRRHRLPTRLSVQDVESRVFDSWEALFYMNNPNDPMDVGSQSADISRARLIDIMASAEDNTLSDDPTLNVFIKNFLYSFRELR